MGLDDPATASFPFAAGCSMVSSRLASVAFAVRSGTPVVVSSCYCVDGGSLGVVGHVVVTTTSTALGLRTGFDLVCGGKRVSAGAADAVDVEEPRGVAEVVIGQGRCGGVSQSSDFGHEPADSAILCGDRLACGAESAFAIGELDFGGLAALFSLGYYAAQFVDLRPGCGWHHDVIASLSVLGTPVKVGSLVVFVFVGLISVRVWGGGPQSGSRWSARSAARTNDLEAGEDPPHTDRPWERGKDVVVQVICCLPGQNVCGRRRCACRRPALSGSTDEGPAT